VPLAGLGCRRTTGANCVGAMFQDGSRFSSGLTVRHVRRIDSAGRKDASRPDMGREIGRNPPVA